MKIFDPEGQLGPNAPLETNAAGGHQSVSPVELVEGFPHLAVLAVGKVIKAGVAKYGPGNWRKIPRSDHLNHALTHLFALLAGDKQDAHLEHAACRILMALETE